MSKCIFCHKENDGSVCSHCLAKGATNTGNALKNVGSFAIKIVPIIVVLVSTRGKGKFKI
jgi:hypothetical protein